MNGKLLGCVCIHVCLFWHLQSRDICMKDIRLLGCMYVRKYACMYICMAGMNGRLIGCMPVCLSVCLSICLSVCLSLFASQSRGSCMYDKAS